MDLMKTIARALGAGPIDDSGLPDEPGAHASKPETTTMEIEAMSTVIAAPGAGVNAGISEADHAAAVAKAQADGKAAGRKEASDRFGAILGAEGVKGDGGRMAAAFDLASQSPDMSAEAVVTFVSTNVAATKSSSASSYEEQRLVAGGLTARGGGEKPNNDNKSVLASAVARTNKRR